jgi:hypothetical protein
VETCYANGHFRIWPTKRLPISGASLVSTGLSRADLRAALERLQVSRAFDDAALDDLYTQLCEISGAWLANEQSKEAVPVRSALLQIGKHLTVVVQHLSGHQNGVRSTTEIFATGLTKLALDPTLKTDVDGYLTDFLEHVRRVSHAAQVAAAKLAQKSSIRGKEKLHWYDASQSS